MPTAPSAHPITDVTAHLLCVQPRDGTEGAAEIRVVLALGGSRSPGAQRHEAQKLGKCLQSGLRATKQGPEVEAGSGTTLGRVGMGDVSGVVFKLKDWQELGMERLRGTAL